MNFPTLKRIVLFGALIVLMSRCGPDAPHDNPLDPLNPSANFSIGGRVFNFYPPFNGLPNVQVVLLPLNRQTTTGPSGEFIFANIQRGQFQLIGTAPGYRADTLTLTIKQDTTVVLHLDALPRLDSIRITSHRVGRFFPPEDLLYVQFAAVGADPDGASDITRIQFLLPDLSVTDTLSPLQIVNATQVKGAVRKTASELNLTSIENLVGKAVYFTIGDKPGARVTSPPHYLFRVIPRIPTVVSPSALTSIPADSARILFRWEPISFPFAFTFTVELYRLDLGIGTLVNSVTNISADTTEIYLPNPGTAGDYFWVVYVVDEFGNSSRSREGAFRITTTTGG